MSFSAPAHVASQIADAVTGLFRRGTVSASTGLAASTVDYGGQSYPVATALVPFAIGEVPAVNDEVVIVQIAGQPVLLGKVVRSGLTPAYSPVPVVTSLPTASATYRGVLLRTAGAAGVADGVYACVKSSADTYSWVRVDNQSSVFGVLGTATNGSSQSNIGSETSLTSMSITKTIPAGCYVRATITLPLREDLSGGGGRAQVNLKQDGATIKSFTRTFPAMSVNTYQSTTWVWVFTATAASHTFSLSAQDLSSNLMDVGSGGLFVIEAVNAP